MTNARQYTDKELEMLYNIEYNAKELGEILKLPVHVIQYSRRRLGINGKSGRRKGCQQPHLSGQIRPAEIGKKISLAKQGKPNPKKERKETRTCIGKDCSNIFVVVPSKTKKYCSHSCQQKTANVAAKGMGSRKMRNPSTPEYKRYSRQVHGLSQKTYEENKHIINPDQHIRTICGVESGWQLDHITPIKECFEKGLSPQEAAHISNLRMLPWKDNLMRQYKNV